jgi:hypothetical protein
VATKIQSKQIELKLAAPLNIANFSFPAAATADITTTITTALATAGRGGVAVPLQVGNSTTQGVITAAADNVVDVFANATKLPITDANGNEVYGRITEATGVYTLSLFSLVAGTETAFASTAQALDFQFSYSFDLHTLPWDAIVQSSTKHVGDDPAGSGTRLRQATLTPTALNTLPALPVAYNATAGIFQLIVNGQTLVIADGYAVAGTAVTLTPATIGFDITTTDRVYAIYSI